MQAPQSAADALRLRIANGEWTPGQRLGEEDLAEDLGISRNSLREAFTLLAAEGLVVRRPHRGVFIAHVTRAEAKELFRSLLALERSALMYGEDPATLRPRMQELAADIRRGAEAGDMAAVREAAENVHYEITGLLRSRDLSRLQWSLQARVRLASPPLSTTGGVHVHFAQSGASLMQHVSEGRREEAVKALTEYFAYGEWTLLEHSDLAADSAPLSDVD